MTETTEAETITTVTCHIWHESENVASMVDLAQYDSVEDAKEDARVEAFNSFASDLSEPHDVWFVVANRPHPKLRETTFILATAPDPEAGTVEISAAA